jgi:DNA-binding MarR family transcriptional regulator
MPPRAKKVALSDDVRSAFKQQLVESKRQADQQQESFHVTVYLMWKSGLTFDEIAEELGTRSSTVSDWKKKGEEAHGRREQARSGPAGEDPDRS